MKNILWFALLISPWVSADDNDRGNSRPGLQTGFIYGAGVSYQQQIYKGFDQRTIAIPLLGYVGERLNVFGPFMSYSVLKNQDWSIDINLSPRFSGFDEDDSDFFLDMKKRKDSADGGFSIKYNPKKWSFQFKALKDLLSNSNGTDLEFSIAKSYRINGFNLEPSIAINHQNNNLVDYYYGVRQTESNLQRGFYEGSASTNKSLNLSVSKPIGVGLLRLDLEHTCYGSEIKNSPLVDDDSTIGGRLFFITYF